MTALTQLVRTVPVAALLLLPACGGDALFGPAPQIEGEYTLQQVDGQPLPQTISNDGASRVEITAGDVSIGETTWSSRTEFRITTPGGVTMDSQAGGGTWALQGDSIRFDANGTVMGVVRGSTLRVIRRTSGTETVFTYAR